MKLVIERNETNKNSKGGTELMAEGLEQHVDKELLSKFQIIPSRVRELDPTKIPVLWLHDLPWDPESAKLKDPEYRKQFKKIVFVSHWQQQMYNLVLGVPFSEGVVIKNAIKPIPSELIDKSELDPSDIRHGKIRLIYHPTPHRGLEILVPVFNEMLKYHPDIHLDVYSSFKLYGWAERDKPYEALFEEIKKAMEDDGFFELSGITAMLEEMANNVEEATQEQKKPTVVPQDHKKKQTSTK